MRLQVKHLCVMSKTFTTNTKTTDDLSFDLIIVTKCYNEYRECLGEVEEYNIQDSGFHHLYSI